ncbi:hypothetical protein [Citreimonas sp.]|uniref:hypothetical protein n=1 Tax=Citreimonas sp. TaxID=3036715 RepID=UPI0040594F39
MTTTMKAVCYALISHGSRPRGVAPLSDYPAARPQCASMQRLASERNWQHPGMIDRFDYARRIRGPRDLPNLLESLARGAEQGDTIVLIDRFSRVFQRVALADLPLVLEALQPYAEIFYQADPWASLRRVGELPRLVGGRILFDAALNPKARCSKKHDGSGSGAVQTDKARRVSRAVRSRASDHLADRLVELAMQHGDVSIGRLLQAANERGLKNTQGGPLTYQTVRRSLLRAGEKTGRS